MGNGKRLPPPMDPEYEGGFSDINYLKRYFNHRREVNRILDKIRDEMLRQMETSTKIYDV